MCSMKKNGTETYVYRVKWPQLFTFSLCCSCIWVSLSPSPLVPSGPMVASTLLSWDPVVTWEWGPQGKPHGGPERGQWVEERRQRCQSTAMEGDPLSQPRQLMVCGSQRNLPDKLLLNPWPTKLWTSKNGNFQPLSIVVISHVAKVTRQEEISESWGESKS